MFLAIAEGATPLIIRQWMMFAKNDRVGLSAPYALGFFGLAAFLLMRFWEIYLEKWLVIEFLNYLRRTWFQESVRNIRVPQASELASLMAKLTYHFGLLQMGLKNVIFQIPKLVFGFFALIIVSWSINVALFQLVAACLVFSLFLIWLGNFLAKNHVSRDQTLYSRMLREIHSSVSRRANYSLQSNHYDLMQSFDDLVELDSHFRLKRELWMKFSPQLVLIVIALAGMAGYAIDFQGLNFSEIFSINGAVLAMLSALLVRQLYLSLQMGLFLFPLYLGLVLSVPEFKTTTKWQPLPPIRSISFRTKSARIGKGRRKKYQFDLFGGNRILVHAGESSQFVANLLTGGIGMRKGKSWNVVHNDLRMSFNSWSHRPNQVFRIAATYVDDTPLINLFTGKLSQHILTSDIEQVFTDLAGIPYLDELNITPHNMRNSIQSDHLDWEKRMAVQIVAAIVSKPPMIVIEQEITRFESNILQTLLELLAQKANSSIIVCFSKPSFETTHEVWID